MFSPTLVRTFSTLAELGSFTRTAERLGITQAAVSQHVRQLEDKLGPLIVRRSRAIELTPAGSTLLDYCREIAQADRRFQLRLDGAGSDVGEISIITPGSVGLLLYPLLLTLQEQRPGMVVRHRFAPDTEVLDAVLDNRFELGLVTAKPDDPRLSALPITTEPLELVVPVGKSAGRWEDLERLGFIDHPDGQAMAIRLLNRRFPSNPGVRTLPVRGFTNQVGLILEPVARGLGFTVLPRYARLAFGRLDAIDVVDHARTIVDTLWLIHRSEWDLPPRTRRTVEYLRSNLDMTA